MATIGVFAIIFSDQERILCVRMNYASKNWTTPGGKVEPGESPIGALKREVFEETGYRVEPKQLIGVYAKLYNDDLVLCFEVQVLSREPWGDHMRFEGPEAVDVDYVDYHERRSIMSRMHNPAHPGEVLREYLPEDMTVTEAARRLKVTRQQLSALLNKRSGISAEMALRLAAALGTSAEMWISMQAAYDLWQARRKPQPKVKRIAA